jgi:hypothetical protein
MTVYGQPIAVTRQSDATRAFDRDGWAFTPIHERAFGEGEREILGRSKGSFGPRACLTTAASQRGLRRTGFEESARQLWNYCPVPPSVMPPFGSGCPPDVMVTPLAESEYTCCTAPVAVGLKVNSSSQLDPAASVAPQLVREANGALTEPRFSVTAELVEFDNSVP